MNREKLEGLRARWADVPGGYLYRVNAVDLLDALLEESPDVGPVQGRPDVTEDIAAFHKWGRALAERIRGLENGQPSGVQQDLWERLLGHADRLTALETKAEHPLLVLSREQEARLEALESTLPTFRAALASSQGVLEALRAERIGAPDVGARAVTPILDRTLTCWAAGCSQPATWRGPTCVNSFVGEWRACDRHRKPTDTPMEPPDVEAASPEPTLHEKAVDRMWRRQAHEWVTAAEVGPTRGATPCPVCETYICQGDVDARGCDTRAATRKAMQPGKRGIWT